MVSSRTNLIQHMTLFMSAYPISLLQEPELLCRIREDRMKLIRRLRVSLKMILPVCVHCANDLLNFHPKKKIIFLEVFHLG